MPPFMTEIDACRRSPLEQLALDYFSRRPGPPSLSFCRQVLGVPHDDQEIARRLDVSVATVRGWKEIGRRTR